MKKNVLIFSLLSITILLLFPTVASASQLENNPNAEVDSIVTLSQREASVRHRADQKYYYDPTVGWGPLTNVTYRTVWFTNGVENLGYHQVALKRGFSFDTYTWQWSYRVY